MKRKGQAGLEAAFVVLFIAIAMVSIFVKTVDTSGKISMMGEVRAISQGVALELTQRDTLTHLVRIDRNVTSEGEAKADLYVMSADCNEAFGEFKDKLELAGYEINKFTCKKSLYLDRNLKDSDL